MPRLVGASAWISSTMIVSTPRSRSRERPASNRYSDSGVVIRICAGSLRWRSRSLAGVSPVRTSTVIARAGAEPLQAGERRAQVALDVIRQRLDRRHVDDARARPLARLAREPIEAPQERGERLAAAGRREHQRVVAARDARPAAPLDRGRGGKALREPRTRGFAEGREGLHAGAIASSDGKAADHVEQT